MIRLRQHWLAPDHWPLATQLSLAMLCVAVIAVILLFYDLNRANGAEVERLQTTALRNSARDLAHGLDALVLNEQSRIANLALSRSAQEFVSVRPNQRSALFTPTLADFTNFIASNPPFYQAVLLLDQAGEVLIATDGSYVGQRFPDSAFFQVAWQGTPYMSDPGISPLDHQPVIWLAAPVYAHGASAPTDVPAGVVTVALDPEEIWHTVEQVRIGERGYALLLDQHGIRLAHGQDRSYVFRSLAPLSAATWAELQAEGRFANLPQLAYAGNTALLDYVRSDPLPDVLIAAPEPDTGRVYYSAARLQERPWTVVAMLSEREVLAPAAHVTLRGLIATIIVVMVLGVTVAWMARRIVRPLPRLAQEAARIAGGDLSVPIDVQGGSEVRMLAENFETMRQRLEQARDELAAWAKTLEQRVALRSQELATLSEVVALASRNQSTSDLLQTALERALPVMGAEMGGIWLADANDRLHLDAKIGFDQELDRSLATFAPGEGLLGQVQMRSQPVAIDDIGLSPRLARTKVKEAGWHAFAAVPLSVADRTLGVLGVFSRVRQGFSPEAMSLVTSIGQQIALTLDNSALVVQLQDQARNVAALQEREHIAGEIHDGIAQNLSYLYLQLDRLADDVAVNTPAAIQTRLLQLEEILNATIGEVRQFIARLQDVAPPPAPLGECLRAEVAHLTNELSLEVAMDVPSTSDMVVPADISTELGRIVGEALRNAQRHGHAAYVSVEIQRQNGHGYVRVRDDGMGFDPNRPPVDDRGHYGLNVMRARAARIGGSLSVISQPGSGTCIEVRWPVERQA